MKEKIAHAVDKESDETRRDSEVRSGRAMPDFAKELRALGQALEKFQFSAFDLELKNGLYLVIGRTGTTDRIKFSFSRLLRELLHNIMPRTTFTYSQDQMDLTFSPEEIQQFDERGKGKRQDPNKMPDPYSISQILRGAGSYLDNRDAARLSSISLRDKWMTVAYESVDGRLEQAKQDLEYFYDFWVKMYMRRSNRTQLQPPSEPTVFVTWAHHRHQISNVRR